MDSQSVTGWIDQLAEGNKAAAERLWRHVSLRLEDFARRKLDVQTRRRYDEQDAANSAFHSLCLGLAEGRIEAQDRDAFWGLLAVITSRKISAQRRHANRQKRGGGNTSGESAFGDAGINQFQGGDLPPDVAAEVTESCDQLLNAIAGENLRSIVLLKWQGATNRQVADELECTERTVERKLERIRRIWVEAGLHDNQQF
ncbi:MAG: ECF-type sigma factor [Planctomycetaceae bacterium]